LFGDYIPDSPLDRPWRVFSLLDMIEIIAKQVMDGLVSLHHLLSIMDVEKKSRPLEVPNNASCNDFRERLRPVRYIAARLEMRDSLMHYFIS